MTYGDTLKKLFDAHISDIMDPEKRYVHANLNKAITEVPKLFLKDVKIEFSAMSSTIKDYLLKCPHSNINRPYNTKEECKDCGGYRIVIQEERDDSGWQTTNYWSEWTIY